MACIDIDVHHGNGQQSIFYSRSDVLTISLHMHQGAWDEGTSHPETGGSDEVGVGDGIGYNLNIPLDLGFGDSEYIDAFEQLVVPAVNDFKPTFLVVCCGVDGSCVDTLGRQTLTMAGFFAMAAGCRKLADAHAGGRCVVTQEGGYSLSYAAYCVHAVLEGIAGRDCSQLRDPLDGTYPNPALRDPQNERVKALALRLRAEREAAIAAARAAR